MSTPFQILHDARIACKRERHQTAAIGKGKRDREEQDPFVANMPKDLAFEDCLVDKQAYGTMEDQRAFFSEQMRAMAREGQDEEDGWIFASKTALKGLPLEEQLDVYARKVDWSKAEQLRSVVETEFTCDKVFDHLLAIFTGSMMGEAFRNALTSHQARSHDGNRAYPFVSVDKDSVTALMLQDVPFPWPLTPRYVYVVQDYVRVRGDGQQTWFFTYNQDVEHPYFSSRNGYVRANVRFQGLVGVPLSGAKAEGRRNEARLTWLINMDCGGLVPSSFVRQALFNTMFFPQRMVTELRQMQSAPSLADAPSRDDTARSAATDGLGNSKIREDDGFFAEIPKDLTVRDCLVAKFKGKTLDEQRSFFVEKLTEMAREGRGEEDGWRYKGKTNAVGVEAEDQLDIYERTVEWSAVKQLRTVVETEDFS